MLIGALDGVDGRVDAVAYGVRWVPRALETLNAYDHGVRDIQSATPCGRLVLLEGPPGTGKSYLMRGVMYAVEEAEFLVIPPHKLPSMVGPTLVNALFEFAEELRDGLLSALTDFRVLVSTYAARRMNRTGSTFGAEAAACPISASASAARRIFS